MSRTTSLPLGQLLLDKLSDQYDAVSIAESVGLNRERFDRVMRGEATMLTLAEIVALVQCCGVAASRLAISTIHPVVVKAATFGDILRELRRQKGLTQADAAKLTGIPSSSYAQYESDRRTPPYPSVVKICRAFAVSLDHFADAVTDEGPPEDDDPIPF